MTFLTLTVGCLFGALVMYAYMRRLYRPGQPDREFRPSRRDDSFWFVRTCENGHRDPVLFLNTRKCWCGSRRYSSDGFWERSLSDKRRGGEARAPGRATDG